MNLTLWRLVAIVVVAALCSEAFIFPSFGVTVCESAGEQCDTKLLAIVQIQDEGSDWSLEYTIDADEVILGDDGLPWAPSSPIHLTFVRNNTVIEYPLTLEQTYRNAYERVDRVGVCTGGDRTCCSENGGYFLHSLDHNTTTYNSFRIGRGTHKTDIYVIASQPATNTRQSLHLSMNEPSGALPGLSAEMVVISVPFSNYFEYSAFRLFSPTHLSNSEGFLVEDYYVSPLPNSVGITDEFFTSSFQCGQRVGDNTRVAGGDRYDQFSSFRSTRMQSYQSSCFRDSGQSTATHLHESSQIFRCAQSGNVHVNLELSASTFRLRKLYGIPHVVADGILPYHEWQERYVIFLDISNVGDYQGVMEVRPKRCCVGMECEIFSLGLPISVGLEPFETKRVRFTVDANLVKDTEGFCEVDINQHGVTQIADHRIWFDATGVAFVVDPAAVPVDDNHPTCLSPQHIVVVDHVVLCVNGCAADEEWSDVDAACMGPGSTGMSDNDACAVKYAGARNFFNVLTGQCEPVPVCASLLSNNGEFTSPTILRYNSTTNQCESVPLPPAVTPLPPPTLNGSGPITGSCSDLGNCMSQSAAVACGPHGTPSGPAGEVCVCEDGFVTSRDQDPFNFQWCAQALPETNAEPYQNGTVGTGPPAGSGLAAVFVLLSLSSGACVCLCCCCALVVLRSRRAISPSANHRRR